MLVSSSFFFPIGAVFRGFGLASHPHLLDTRTAPTAPTNETALHEKSGCSPDPLVHHTR